MLDQKIKVLETLYRRANDIDQNAKVLNSDPATVDRLHEYELELGYALTPELTSLYRSFDGNLNKSNDKMHLLFATHKFNSLNESLAVSRQLIKLNLTARQSEYDDGISGRLYKDYYFNHRLGAIQHMEFHPHWFPIGSNPGISTYIMVDHAPGKNGTCGQVIYINYGRKAIVLADSISEYLATLIKNYSYASTEESDYRVMVRLSKKGYLSSLLEWNRM